VAGRVRRARAAAAHGQHFLRSARLAAAIVDEAGIEPGDLVVEVGAGGGILTAELIGRGAHVIAVEIDPAWAERLRTRFADAVVVHEGDVLGRGWPGEPFKVVANLPFARGTAVLRSLLDHPRVPLVSAHVVLQWEPAWKRAAPWPSTLLGVLWGAWYDLRVVRRFSRTAFAPPPDVDAALLRIVRRTRPLVPDGEAGAFHRFVRRGFDGAPLARLVPPRTLRRLAFELGFNPHARARDLDAHQWAILFREGLYASVRKPR
jgi:23S rRNA (adenine-N6)-dimethyltransferase